LDILLQHRWTDHVAQSGSRPSGFFDASFAPLRSMSQVTVVQRCQVPRMQATLTPCEFDSLARFSMRAWHSALGDFCIIHGRILGSVWYLHVSCYPLLGTGDRLVTSITDGVCQLTTRTNGSQPCCHFPCEQAHRITSNTTMVTTIMQASRLMNHTTVPDRFGFPCLFYILTLTPVSAAARLLL
jgi:hypothetical protein